MIASLKDLLTLDVEEWVRHGVIAVAVGASCFLLGQCDGARDERAKWEAKEAREDAQLQQQARAADQNLNIRKQNDEAAIAADRKEFDDATKHLGKTGLTARQRIDACIQLRRQAEPETVLARAGCFPEGAAPDARPASGDRR